jgi:hypothetical protein
MPEQKELDGVALSIVESQSQVIQQAEYAKSQAIQAYCDENNIDMNKVMDIKVVDGDYLLILDSDDEE